MRGLMLLVPEGCRHPALQDLDPHPLARRERPMSTVRITTSRDERRLVDPDLVGFLRKKLEKGDKLDFTTSSRSPRGILDALFDGWTPEQVGDASIAERWPRSRHSLAAWIDRAGGKVTKAVERPRKARGSAALRPWSSRRR
jgi:hypothetical protein